MADTYTTRNRVTKPEPGQYTNAWGPVLNANAFDLFDQAIDGRAAYTLSGTKTLSSANGSTDEARCKVQHITGGTGGIVTIPAVEKVYFVINESSGTVYFTAGGVQASVPSGSTYMVACDGTDCYAQTPITYTAALDTIFATVSSTSNSIGTGAKSFTVEADKGFQAGDYVFIKDTAAPTTNWMWGTVTSYDSSTGALVTNITETSGSGTKTAWLVNLSGIQGADGDTLPALSSNAYKFLRVNSGETAAEFQDMGYVLLETLSPSGAATSTSAAIPATYNDIYVRHSGSITSGLGIAVSNDGASFSTARVFHSSITATVKTSFRFQGYNFDDGPVSGSITSSSSPALGTDNTTGVEWVCTGGIRYLRFSNGSGNLTATIRIYGKL